MNDAIWKQRAEDQKDVRTAIDFLLSEIRSGETDTETKVRCHKILAVHMQTLERYTRPIPIIFPFKIPLEVFKAQLVRYQELGLPFYPITELKRDDDE